MSQSAKLAKNAILTKRILVAEDNSVNQKLIRRLLSHLGYDADIACNGAEVLNLLERHEYGVILMDIQMPLMDGLTAARAIRSLEGAASRMPIIALTANGFEGTRQKCLAAGMNDFLSKPIEVEKFAAALERWTSQPRVEQKLA